MNRMNDALRVIFIAILFLCVFRFASAAVSFNDEQPPLADEIINSRGISWSPKVNYEQMVLTLSRPDGSIYKKTFYSGNTPCIELSSIIGKGSGDGAYTYQLKVIQQRSYQVHNEENTARLKKEWHRFSAPFQQTGHFIVQYGSIISKSSSEHLSHPMDVVHNDDEIVTGGLCVGPDCKTDGTELFGSDTLKLKANSLRLFFDDTSIDVGFSNNDWRLLINDPSEGGGSFFAIQDATVNRIPFTIQANAPESALFMDTFGRLGLGTATPGTAFHIVNGNSPDLRLEQDASDGFPAQTWDITGNDASFSIRDASHESRLPFRIQPDTPSNALCLKSNGNVGIGTWVPAYPVEVNTTGRNASVVVKRTDGATNYINATPTAANFGSTTNHPLRLIVNTTWKMILNTDNSIALASGASCTTGGVWTNASSRKLKENIHSLTAMEAIQALTQLEPVKYNYKADKTENHVGFIAEDVPQLVATKDRTGMSPMDVVAVLTKVVQEQQKSLQTQQQLLEKQQALINELNKKITILEKQKN